MNKLSQWIYAYKVCKKYDISLNPFHTLSHAAFEFSYWRNYKKSKSTIHINLFYHDFLQSFLHEVGHCLRHRRAYNKATSCENYEQSVSDTMKEEYIAWKFSKRTLKSNFNKTRARDMFKTYFKKACREYGCKQKAADVFYSFDRLIEK